MKTIECDYFVVGSGIAGLLSAIGLAEHGKVLVVTKKDRADSNTNYAQGGIACVTVSGDSFDSHVADTLDAGAGLCDEKVVREIVEKAPGRIEELVRLGVSFADNAAGPGYDLGREGGHSHRRVLHAGDITGREIEGALLSRAQSDPNISIMEQCMVIDLITTAWLADDGGTSQGRAGQPEKENRCLGAYVLERGTGEVMVVRAPYVILASGGGGKAYLYTSNPDIATGDGVAIAWRAGVPVKNMEFIQFHPTCLYHPDAKSFLISEAVRGEGAELVDGDGKTFMEKYDDRGALAPRDIVARAIDNEMKSTGAHCAYLDIRHRSRDYLKERFPNIYETCIQFGFDMSADLIPVVPAAHYFCGGIDARIDGETALAGLFACGEVACTGLHGANRLASNSLLEAVVCAHEMVEKIANMPPASSYPNVSIPDWEPGCAAHSDEAIVVEHNWNEVRTCMWDYVGIVRTDKRLERAARRIDNLRREIRQYYLDYLITADILELRNIAAVSDMIIRSAQRRKESRGLHYTLDHPESHDEMIVDTVIAGDGGKRGRAEGREQM
ncbi:MAG: L-aspartate oxidase, partial [Kiritimatiellae bacterium]|nr:L-aspartate oxidase [Kiritimatiellia bacterium]